MRISLRPSSATTMTARTHVPMSSSWLLVLTSLASFSRAITFNSIPDASLDTSQLGRVGIAGDFSGISLYQYEGQTEQPSNTNGSEQLLARLPNGAFQSLLEADASIQTMCVFQGQVILGGNFTSLGGVQSPGIASFDPDTSKVTQIANLSGQVNSLLCDDSAGKVYVGGSFRAVDSTNAITWLASKAWASLPFAGFNGPVTSIAKAPSGNIIFGGSFTGLGNTSTPSTPDGQVINLSTATIEADQSTSAAGFSDPSNIVCQTGGVDGAGSTWLLEDSTPGAFRATFNVGFEPTKLRLYNTHQDGRGTKTWRFTAQPINGILNFTYIDPATNQNLTCTSECPLSDDPSVKFQDFHFVNTIGMNGFRIDVSAWYGNGGGLDGIQLFQNDIFAYAVNDLNEPSCANTTTPSKATTTGTWTVTPSGQSNSQYLSARLPKPVDADAASVVLYPDIKESGEYIIKLYTPGCLQDNTCLSRGQVSVSGTLSSSGVNQTMPTKVLFQTNEFEKYDQLHIGSVDASSDSFRPSITMTPVAGQSDSIPGDDFVMVAQRVGFELINSTGGLNSLFEYDPSQTSINSSDFSTSAFIKFGSTFTSNSAVASLVATNDRTFVGGNFTADNVRNIAAIDNDGQTVPLDGGLNGEVMSMYLSQDQLFVGGRFNNTQNGSTSGLANVAVYDSSSNEWTPLGAGVDGAVASIVPSTLNLSGSAAEDVITLTGDFTQLLAFGDNTAAEAKGFAVWVKSRSNWLQNLDGPIPFLAGILSTSVAVSDNETLYAGSVSSQVLRASGTVTLSEELGNFPIKIQPASTSTNSTSGSTQHASVANSTTVAGVVTGAFYEDDNGKNVTVLGGHFAASASNGSTIHNLAFIDGADSNAVTGLGTEISEDSVFLALTLQGNNVFAGGRVNGTIQGSTINGLLSYNLASMSFNAQPPALGGSNVVVSSITLRPNSGDIYVGGTFDKAGSLPCPSVCLFSTDSSQWNRPGFELDGDVNDMMWSTDTVLYAGGNLTISNSGAFLASYDASSSHWSEFPGASDLPGPVTALTPANRERNQVWATGTQPDGSTYLMKYDGSTWKSAGVELGARTQISSLQMFTVNDAHDSSDTLDSNQVLMMTGSVDIPGFGTASSAIFNGTTVQPYALTSSTDSPTGSISRVFVQHENFFTSAGNTDMPLVFVALIGLAISLGVMVLIVLAGLALDRYRKKREGYIPAPTSMFDRGSGMQRIPPHELLQSLGQGRPGAPHV
ncbi:cortical protein marker for cell polarity-domain-containing protein [Hypoxylon sp. FL1284]|nr:cortical protein marker for cell polarity-domain-containing protein [Hypoxylon sp. FL1284]